MRVRDLAGNPGLYRSTKVNGAFSTPTLVPGVNLDTPAVENNPVVTADELTLFFGSTRPGGTGDYDIYEARRASVADGFGAPIELAGLNTTGGERDRTAWIAAVWVRRSVRRIQPRCKCASRKAD